MLSVLVSLYLGGSRTGSTITRGSRNARRLGVAIVGSLGGFVLLAWILVPPIVEQTRQLILALPDFMNAWEVGIDRVAARLPGVSDIVGRSDEHKALLAAYDQLSGLSAGIPTKLFEVLEEAAINVFAVLVMSIYLSVHPALYREWLIALFPPIHRDLVRDVLAELADSLRAYIVGQLLTMTFLGMITGLGLWLLGVPFAFLFGIFTGALVAIVPFFGTPLSTMLPALFVLNGKGYFGFSPGGHAMLVVGRLGVVVHLIEGNLVSPLIMSKKVDLLPCDDDHGGAHHGIAARRTRSRRGASHACCAHGDREAHRDQPHLRRDRGFPPHHARTSRMVAARARARRRCARSRRTPRRTSSRSPRARAAGRAREAGGPVDRWTGGPVDRWGGFFPPPPLDRWTGGPGGLVDRWTGGPVGGWTGGPVDPLPPFFSPPPPPPPPFGGPVGCAAMMMSVRSG